MVSEFKEATNTPEISDDNNDSGDDINELTFPSDFDRGEEGLKNAEIGSGSIDIDGEKIKQQELWEDIFAEQPESNDSIEDIKSTIENASVSAENEQQELSSNLNVGDDANESIPAEDLDIGSEMLKNAEIGSESIDIDSEKIKQQELWEDIFAEQPESNDSIEDIKNAIDENRK